MLSNDSMVAESLGRRETVLCNKVDHIIEPIY